jgi:hypothetical protein
VDEVDTLFAAILNVVLVVVIGLVLYQFLSHR